MAHENMTLLVDGRRAFPEIIRCIEGAETSVEINMFIWRDDRIGNRMAQAVLTAADRGAQVHISVDRYGVVLEKCEECKRSFFHKRQTLTEKMKSKLLEAIYPDIAEPGAVKDERTPIYDRLLNHPNITVSADEFKADHSKYYIIDDEILFLGGINIEDKENGRDLRGRVYGDYMIGMCGEGCIPALEAARGGKETPASSEYRFFANCKETGVFGMEEHYLSLIASAKRELLIVMAYLSPLPRFMRAIADAHRRGVRVTVMIPEAANFQNDTNRRAARRLMKLTGNGITLLFSKKMLHTKLVLTEREISIGSCNITKKAFGQLDELNLAVKNGEDPFAAAIRKSLARELREATKIEHYRHIRYRRFLALAEGLLV